MNYQQQAVAGTSHIEAKRVILDNSVAIPKATFIEQKVLMLGDETINRDVGVLNADMTNPGTVFNLLDPADDSVIGTMTYEQFYGAVRSLHRHLAVIRDAGNI
jgi:hypothetical protein